MKLHNYFVQFIPLQSNLPHKILIWQINKYQKPLKHKHVEKCVASDSFHAFYTWELFFQDKITRLSFCMNLFAKEIVNTENVKECNFRREHFPMC